MVRLHCEQVTVETDRRLSLCTVSDGMGKLRPLVHRCSLVRAVFGPSCRPRLRLESGRVHRPYRLHRWQRQPPEFRTSDMTPRVPRLPRRCRTLATFREAPWRHPTTVQRSVSMRIRCGPLLAVSADAEVVDVNPGRHTATMKAQRASASCKRTVARRPDARVSRLARRPGRMGIRGLHAQVFDFTRTCHVALRSCGLTPATRYIPHATGAAPLGSGQCTGDVGWNPRTRPRGWHVASGGGRCALRGCPAGAGLRPVGP